MYTTHNISDDFHSPKNVSNSSDQEDFPKFHPWPCLTSFTQLPLYCYLTATTTTTRYIPLTEKEWANVNTSGTAQLETLVCKAQRPFSLFSESTRTVLSWQLWFLPIWKWSRALRNRHNILLWFFESGKSSWDPGVPGVRKQTFLVLALSKADSGIPGVGKQTFPAMALPRLRVANSVCCTSPIFFHTVSKLESPNFPISNL